ncbi:MAG TPA: segregation/condensation protein A [bacterium]|jgi:segregation and condensation protein A|nr:segregation/condensation protein A [bacterium]HNT66786.1 segregation/condensation protein A [bacterium]
MPYKVKLDTFEGPLDLLLFLIKKEEVDIYDIPIAKITRQFLEYLEIIQLLDLEVASDFILMAATLMRIKAQMLLPKPEVEAQEEEEIDPRQELVQRLLEYKRFKDVAEQMCDYEESSRQIYQRGTFRIEDDGSLPIEEGVEQVSLFALIGAFQKVLRQQKKVSFHRVQELPISLEERLAFIESKFQERSEIEFSELFDAGDSRMVLIVTFIAILELIKRKFIRAAQEINFADIKLIRVDG